MTTFRRNRWSDRPLSVHEEKTAGMEASSGKAGHAVRRRSYRYFRAFQAPVSILMPLWNWYENQLL